jgi:ketosteroid isomerase-like protein
MSQEDVEVVRAMFDRLARGDFSRWFDEVTDDFVYVTSPDIPDAGTFRGVVARNWIMAWVESFEGHTMQASEFIDADDKVVCALVQRGRPRGSQATVEGRWWLVVTFRDGAIAKAEAFIGRDQALEAAGLQE